MVSREDPVHGSEVSLLVVVSPPHPRQARAPAAAGQRQEPLLATCLRRQDAGACRG